MLRYNLGWLSHNAFWLDKAIEPISGDLLPIWAKILFCDIYEWDAIFARGGNVSSLWPYELLSFVHFNISDFDLKNAIIDKKMDINQSHFHAILVR